MARVKSRKIRKIEGPTREQEAAAPFDMVEVTHVGDGASVTIGKAYRRKPMIAVLSSMFSDAEFRALKHYRHHADIADRSPLRDSLDKQVRGNGTGPTVEMLNAIRVRDDCERAAGSLRDILRAVVVYDISLSQWAVAQAGGVENCREKGGRTVCRIEPKRKALDIAQLEIKMAELDA
jgi:hypothetical protein